MPACWYLRKKSHGGNVDDRMHNGQQQHIWLPWRQPRFLASVHERVTISGFFKSSYAFTCVVEWRSVGLADAAAQFYIYRLASWRSILVELGTICKSFLPNLQHKNVRLGIKIFPPAAASEEAMKCRNIFSFLSRQRLFSKNSPGSTLLSISF